jgi:hypothetical protein
VSKPLVKADSNRSPQRIAHELQKYSQSSLPQTREINAPAVRTESSPLVATYKDLDQPARDFELNQKRQLVFGVFTFVILGVGIMIGQKYSSASGSSNNTVEKRVVASDNMVKMIPKDANVNSAEHYEYDKSCYTQSNGEHVCTTRVSRNRD